MGTAASIFPHLLCKWVNLCATLEESFLKFPNIIFCSDSKKRHASVKKFVICYNRHVLMKVWNGSLVFLKTLSSTRLSTFRSMTIRLSNFFYYGKNKSVSIYIKTQVTYDPDFLYGLNILTPKFDNGSRVWTIFCRLYYTNWQFSQALGEFYQFLKPNLVTISNFGVKLSLNHKQKIQSIAVCLHIKNANSKIFPPRAVEELWYDLSTIFYGQIEVFSLFREKL